MRRVEIVLAFATPIRNFERCKKINVLPVRQRRNDHSHAKNSRASGQKNDLPAFGAGHAGRGRWKVLTEGC